QPPPNCATARQHWGQSACEDTDVRLRAHEMAETVRNTAILHAPGHLHIGVAAYFVWASPPNNGGTACRHVHVHRHMTVAYPTVADAMIETKYLRSNQWC